jgi:hypothetical protein
MHRLPSLRRPLAAALAAAAALSATVAANAQEGAPDGPAPAATAAAAARVVVVCNRLSAISRAVADDYQRRRGVGALVEVSCPDAATGADQETIAYADYQSAIEAPLRAYLAGHPGIDYIVLTKGVPIRVKDAPRGVFHGLLALDSVLAALDYDHDARAREVDITDRNFGPTFHGHAWANRFWNSATPFSHVRNGGWLVTRLDGYTAADAISLTARALAAEARAAGAQPAAGPILLDVCPAVGTGDPAQVPVALHPAVPDGPLAIAGESRWGDWNADLQRAEGLLRARAIPCRLDASGVFAGGEHALMGYASWGSNDSHYDAAAYHSLGFAPGALAETAVSTSARTFLPTSGGQSLIADLISQGLTGGKGYTDEPLLQAIAAPSILFDRFTQGWTLADSLYAASALVGWQDIVIGDPLCRAYPRR